MGVTRDPEYPVRMAKLFEAFNHCADGYEAGEVLDVAVNLVIAAVGYQVKETGGDLDRAVEVAHRIGEVVAKGVIENWNRQPQNADVEVKLD